MPGSIHISATQPPVITPLFLQVTVGKREYSGNIEQDDLSFPVISLRESMAMMLYNADRELISKSELKTKTIVESGTMDTVFALDSGGKIILQVQFLLNDDDRKRIQEMRNSAMKRKQQELLGDATELNFPDSPLSKRLIEKISNIQSKGSERSKLRKSLSLDDLQERAVFSGINVVPQMKEASRDLLLQRGVRDTLSLEDPSGSKKQNNIPESKLSNSVKKMISTFEGITPQDTISEIDASPTPTGSSSTQASKAVILFDDHKASNCRSGETVLSQHIKTSEPIQTGMPKTTESRRSRRSATSVPPTPTGSGRTLAGKAVIPFDDHKASNWDDHKASNCKSGKTILSQHIKPSEHVQTRMPEITESRRSHRSEIGVSPTRTDSGSMHGCKAVIPFDDHKASNYRPGETFLSQHIKMIEPIQTWMPKTNENIRSCRSETGVSPTPTDSRNTQAGKAVDDHKASDYRPEGTVLSQHIKTSEHLQTGMLKTTESRRSRRSETSVSPTHTDSGSMQAGKAIIPIDDHKASNYKLGETVSSEHIKTSEPVQTGMPKTNESRRSQRYETGVSPTPRQAGKPVDDHKASDYRPEENVLSQHIKTSEQVQTGMPKTTESKRSRRSETGVSPTPTKSGNMQAGKAIIPLDDHKASNYKSGETVSSQHIKTSEPVQTGMPKTNERRRSQRSETVVSSTTTDLGNMQAGKADIPFDDHKASNYMLGETALSQHIKTSEHVQTGMPKTTESNRSHRSGSRDGASKQNPRDNELIRTKRRPQAKHQCSIGPSYLAERMHSREYVEGPLNYLVATSSTQIHPHICVTSGSKQLKYLLEIERLNSLAHIQYTAKRQHVKKDIQENKSEESIASDQTQSAGFPMINGWLINQGVRAAIVVIACGAMFFNNI